MLRVKSTAVSEYWGDMSRYFQPHTVTFTTGLQQDYQTSVREVSASRMEGSISYISKTERTLEIPERQTVREINQEPDRNHSELDQRIQTIRRHYIVGNICGADIYGANGIRILGAGQIITEEAVEQADQAGKLPDLIVNMLLPGQEVE